MIQLLHLLAAAGCNPSKICPGNLPQPSTSGGSGGPVETMLSIVFGIVGALSLLMVVVSGLRYTTSAGSPEKTSRAKNSIIYSLLGLVLAITAEAIVAFVVNRL